MSTVNSVNKSRLGIHTLTLIGVMSAVTCILGPLSIPIGPVPITFTNLAIYLTVILLGTYRGTISYLIYLLIGLIGVPVFSGFTSGPAKLFGPTGGYLIGFTFMALISGFFINHFPKKYYMYALGMILGTAVCYLFGSAWLAHEASLSFSAAMAAGVYPFIIGDLAKIIIALIAGPAIKSALVKANLL